MKLHPIFQSGMMLQRDKPVCLWGEARPGTEVCVRAQGRTWTGTADETGHFFLSIGPLSASKGEQVHITGDGEQLTLSDVAVGDVYLAGGQSNMEYHMRYERFVEEERPVCANDSVRFYDVPECAYEGQERDFDYSNVGLWRKATPDDLDFFSAPGYYFAKRLQQALDIPVGIVGLNWGGTRSSAWMSEAHARAICPEQAADFKTKLQGQRYEDFIAAAGQNPLNDRGNSVWDPFADFIIPRTPVRRNSAPFWQRCPPGAWIWSSP